ncbi:MAG: carbohydrate ABC transporter permease [Clostridiales bacterium]|nr:carbohydrate ABC transporter permease [Clostridiales bacterium]
MNNNSNSVKKPNEIHQRSAAAIEQGKKRRRREASFQIFVTVITIIFVLLAFIPIFLMVFLSLQNQAQFYANLWAIPIPPEWSNYAVAWQDMFQNMINSMITVSVGTVMVVALAAMSGYVFARLEFPLKNFLFMLMLALMMVPGVLTLTPAIKLVQRLHLKNTWWALWLPWVSGGQIMGMYLCRTFISGQSPALFEAARIDGCTEFKAFYKIAVPLAKPILATLVVMNMISFYGDFIWPLLVIDSNSKQVISVAVQTYSSSTGSTDYGAMIAGFAIATVPLLIMFMFSSRLYIEGITSGAVKA